jgi:hypothetical protein
LAVHDATSEISAGAPLRLGWRMAAGTAEAILTPRIWSRPVPPLVTQRTRHIAVADAGNSPTRQKTPFQRKTYRAARYLRIMAKLG